jgi:hypothetical protein
VTEQPSSAETNSTRDDLAALARRQGDGWMLLLYYLLTKLRFLAEPPKERELRHDLYVMF